MEGESSYDIVIVGASGFTGKYVIREFLTCILSFPSTSPHPKLALAGRSTSKLREALQWASVPFPSLSSSPLPIPLVEVDLLNPDAIARLCQRSKVIVNCVGPYQIYGESVVAACIEAGIDYVDVAGETEFLERMELKYHRKALQKGSLIVSACGYVSLLADIGLLHHLQQWRPPLLPNSVDSFLHSISEKPIVLHYTSIESAILGIGNVQELYNLRKSRPRPPKITIPGPPARKPPVLHYEPSIGLYGTKLPNSDSAVVRRTFRALAEKRAYLSSMQNGTKDEEMKQHKLWSQLKPAHYGVYLGSDKLTSILKLILGRWVVMGLSKYEWGRCLLQRYPEIFTGGTFTRKGPTEDEVESCHFEMWFVGKGYNHEDLTMDANNSHLNTQIITKISGPESGYLTTSITLAQCALLILDQRHSLPRGVLTPTIAFGATNLVERLKSRGLVFEVISTKND